MGRPGTEAHHMHIRFVAVMSLVFTLPISGAHAAATEIILGAERGFVTCVQPVAGQARLGCIRALDLGDEIEVSMYRGFRFTTPGETVRVSDSALVEHVSPTGPWLSLEAQFPDAGRLVVSFRATTFGVWGSSGTGHNDYWLISDTYAPDAVGGPAIVEGTLDGVDVTSEREDGTDAHYWISPVSGYISAG